MTDIEKYVLMGFGAILAIIGIILFAKKQGQEGTNKIKLLGAEFELSAPSLVIFIVGVALIISPFFLDKSVIPPQRKETHLPPKISVTNNISNLIIDTWMTLENSFKHQEIPCKQELTWLSEYGIRGFYCHIKTSLSYKHLQELLEYPIFVKGPHSRSHLNLDARYEFGYYNKEFVKWLADNAIIGVDDPAIREKAQPVFDKYIRRQARVYYVAYKYLLDNKLFLDDVKQEYLEHLQNHTLPSLFLQEKFRSFADETEDKGHNWYEANAAGGFWVRRFIDGTATEFFTGLQTLLLTYDSNFVFEQRGFGY